MTQTLSHLSEKPWGAYTAADYSVEQWHASCLIHQHDGPPTSKSQCKLPVKTPTGAINRNGVHAAAAALAGARGGVHASPAEKSKAANALIRYYHQMDEKPPPSLLSHSVLEHYGTKGMRWGVRKASGSARAAERRATARKHDTSHMSDAELRQKINRIKMDAEYKKLNSDQKDKGAAYAKKVLGKAGNQTVEAATQTVATAIVAATIGIAVKKGIEKAATSYGKKKLARQVTKVATKLATSG